MDLKFTEVEALPPPRTWMWLGIACVATLLLVLFLVSPAAAAVAGLVLLAAIPLAVIAGTKRTTAPLAVVGVLALVALGSSAVSLAVTMGSPESVSAPGAAPVPPASGPSPSPDVARPTPTPSQGPARPLPAPAEIAAAPSTPEPTVEPAPAPVQAPAPAAEVPAAPAPAPVEAPAPAPAPEDQAPAPVPAQILQDRASSGGWGQLPDSSRAQVCAAAASTGLKMPPGQCK